MAMTLIVIVALSALVAVAAAVAAARWATNRAEAEAATRAQAARAEYEQTQAEMQAGLRQAIDDAVGDAVAASRRDASEERDAAIKAALDSSAVLHREQLGAAAAKVEQQVGADLEAKKDVIGVALGEVRAEVRNELGRLHELVNTLGETSAVRFGQVESSLSAHAEVTRHLQQSTNSLSEALTSSQTRGQWGERMAEDVLRLAGFQENVNYVKQVQIEGGSGRPDFTFPMPKGQQLFMDVKFPMASYLRYLEAGTDAERDTYLQKFLRDVRLRVRELAKRDYAGEGDSAVDYVLLFLPNEQLSGFIHEHDAALLDDAMEQKIVLCSPLTLFAFLGVIRQAFDNFVIEQTSDEILSLLGVFDKQWAKYAKQVDTVKKRLESVNKAFDDLAGPRRRMLERPLQQIEDLRVRKGLPIDGELFPESMLLDDSEADTDTPPDGNVRALGA